MSRHDGPVGPRASLAPPRESNGLSQRTGYAVLAASGLVVATAFAVVAQLAGPGTASDIAGPHGNGQGTTPEGQVIQGNGVPGGPMTIPGAGAPGEVRPFAAPTTVISVGPDGRVTTTVLLPPLPGQPAPPIPPGSIVVPGPPGSSIIPTPGSTTTPPGTSTSPTEPSPTTGTTTTPPDTSKPTSATVLPVNP